MKNLFKNILPCNHGWLLRDCAPIQQDTTFKCFWKKWILLCHDWGWLFALFCQSVFCGPEFLVAKPKWYLMWLNGILFEINKPFKWNILGTGVVVSINAFVKDGWFSCAPNQINIFDNKVSIMRDWK